MPKYELIPSAPGLVLFHGSIFQCRDPPFVQLSKLETQDSSWMPPPFLPTPFANLFSGSLGFYFCKSAHFYHPHLHCPGPFSWPPVCYAFIYPYFCVFYKHKVNLFTSWLRTLKNHAAVRKVQKSCSTCRTHNALHCLATTYISYPIWITSLLSPTHPCSVSWKHPAHCATMPLHMVFSLEWSSFPLPPLPGPASCLPEASDPSGVVRSTGNFPWCHEQVSYPAAHGTMDLLYAISFMALSLHFLVRWFTYFSFSGKQRLCLPSFFIIIQHLAQCQADSRHRENASCINEQGRKRRRKVYNLAL